MNEQLQELLTIIRRVGRTAPRFTTGFPKADDLVFGEPFAFLLACSLDRGMQSEIIWRIPYRLQQHLGHLSPDRLAHMTVPEIRAVLEALPERPRYVGDAAVTISEVAQVVSREFGGDAERVWLDRPVADIHRTLLSIHGIGTGIAAMTLNLLHRYRGVEFSINDLRLIDVKPDVHVERVFQRTGITVDAGRSVEAARGLSAEYPADLDLGAWEIGRRWCHATAPDHETCALSAVCPRIGLGISESPRPRAAATARAPVSSTDAHHGRSPMSGGAWSFEDFCVVYCNQAMGSAALAQQLGRTVGAIDAVKASIQAVLQGKATPTFPGRKWEELVRRAQSGECRCAQTTGIRQGRTVEVPR